MDSKRPLRILCLDGGGVRGISSLYILKELMGQARRERETGPEEIKSLRPCDFFDLICGTSTGGMIALMLGRMKMNVGDAITFYEQMSKEIFTSKSENPEAAFDHRILVKSIKDVITCPSVRLDAESILKDEDEHNTKTFVVSTSLQGTGATAVRMRTYGTKTSDPFEAKIWEAARATSAAPTIFEPITIDRIKYGDGGTGWNNPAEEAVNEANRIWPNRPIGCLVSIGTGLEDPAQLRDKEDKGKDDFARKFIKITAPKSSFKLAVAEYCVKILTSCEKIHQRLDGNPAMYGIDGRYFRLNVPQGMSKIGLEEWDKLDEIKALTHSYMDTGDCLRMKQKIAKTLLDPQCAVKAHERDKNGYTALDRAALKGDVEEIQIQWDQGADLDAIEPRKGYTPLIETIDRNQFDAFKALIAFGANVNKPNRDQHSPLYFCLNWRKDFMFGFTLINEPGIDVNGTDKDDRTPLMLAAMTDSLPFADLILNQGANVNAKDKNGMTAMHFAAMVQSKKVMIRLLKGGADINAQNNSGQTPLRIAVNSPATQSLDWLLKNGANVDIADKNNQTPLQAAKAMNKGVCVRQLEEYANLAPMGGSAENVQAALAGLRIEDAPDGTDEEYC
ncbi:hypothetical protein VC83_08267 [Pseudogymnoascus destructans]|nr:uncharacterized protein VC83_08267 [Pseudogymnoascus destructans]OAF55459.1 hypothetical protein VC83_08267 [Pseudogymnoascus destructans]